MCNIKLIWTTKVEEIVQGKMYRDQSMSGSSSYGCSCAGGKGESGIGDAAALAAGAIAHSFSTRPLQWQMPEKGKSVKMKSFCHLRLAKISFLQVG